MNACRYEGKFKTRPSEMPQQNNYPAGQLSVIQYVIYGYFVQPPATKMFSI